MGPVRIALRANGIFMVGLYGGYLFRRPDQFARFEASREVPDDVPYLPLFHVVRVMTDLPADSDGGLVMDERFGPGFLILLPRRLWYCALRDRMDWGRKLRLLPFGIARRSGIPSLRWPDVVNKHTLIMKFDF